MKTATEGFIDGMSIGLEESLTADLEAMRVNSVQVVDFGKSLDRMYWLAVHKVAKKKLGATK